MNWVKSQKSSFWVWMGIFAAVAIVHLWSLMRYPEPLVDEAWLVSRAWGFLHTGHPFGPLDAGTIEQYPGYWLIYQWLITFLQSLVLRFSPTPALPPLRFESLIMGGILLFLNYRIAQSIGGVTLARVSTLLLALSRSFFYSSHLARYDIYVAVFGYAAIALVILDFPKKWVASLIGGLLASLALDLHFNAILFPPVVLVIIFLKYNHKIISNKVFWSFLGGYLVGCLIYLSIHVFPSPSTYFQLTKIFVVGTHIPPLLNPQKLLESLQDSFTLLVAALTLFILILPFAVYLVAKEKNQASRIILWTNACLLLGVFFLFPQKSAFYSILISPAFSLLIGEFLLLTYKTPWHGKIWDYLYRSWIIGVIMGALIFTLSPLRINYWQLYQQAESQVIQIVKPNDRIMGTQIYWFELNDHTYHSWEVLFEYCALHPGSTIADAFNHFQPDIFILDQPTRNFLLNEEYTGSVHLLYATPSTSVNDYVNTHQVGVTNIDSPVYGTIKVYRLDLSKP